jgi:RNA-directed DNA polymerase
MPDKSNKQGRQMTLRESDGCIVPPKLEGQSSGQKPGNAGVGKAARPSRESGRTAPVRSGGPSVITRLDRITQRAKSHPTEVFNNLFSLLTIELLWHAFRRLKRGKVPGVDGVTVEACEENLRENLEGLLQRLHRGSYRPQAAWSLSVLRYQ